MNTTTNTITDARRQANSFDKANKMKVQGYTWNLLCSKMYRIFKPENTAKDVADYVVDTLVAHCTCPDFAKHGDTCKHLMFIEIELDDAANMEAQCKQYDEEEGGEDATPRPLTVKDVLESLQMRMVADLERTEARIRDTRYPHSSDVERRQSMLTCALEIVGEYWSREYVGRLDLQPASK